MRSPTCRRRRGPPAPMTPGPHRAGTITTGMIAQVGARENGYT
jgi:hypothetical protein